MINYADIPPIQNEVLMDGDPNENSIAIHKVTMERILRSGARDPGDMIALWMFYAYVSRWQNTKQIRATTSYAAEGLSWTEERVRKVKKDLKALGLIEDIQSKTPEGVVSGHYVKIRYIAHASTLPEIQSLEEPDHGKRGDKCLRTRYLNAEELGKGNACHVPDQQTQSPTNQPQGRSQIENSAARAVLDAWNALPCRTARGLSGKRLSSLNARWREPAFRENWREAMDKVAVSRFCQGQNSANWVADFDWFLRPGKLDEILEGKFDDREPKAIYSQIPRGC